MKLIYIANIRMPTEKAHGIQIMNMCRAFADGGVNVELIVPRRKNNISIDPFEYYGFKKNFDIRVLPTFDFIALDKHIGSFAAWLQAINFYLFASFYLLFKNRKSLVYIRDFIGSFLRVLGYRVVYECHDIPKRAQVIFFFPARFASKIVLITNKLRDKFLERDISSKKLYVAPDGVDLERFSPQLTKNEARTQLGLPQDKKIILYTGGFYLWKGVYILAEAVRELSDYMCIFVGGGEKELHKFRTKNGDLIKTKRVVLIEHKLYDKIPRWLKVADVLILPNSGKEEISRSYTSPLKLFEYMASGRPIIASRLPSIQEILNDENAFLFESDNAKDLASKIRYLLNNQKFADNLASNALREVREYTWKKRAQNILAFVKK